MEDEVQYILSNFRVGFSETGGRGLFAGDNGAKSKDVIFYFGKAIVHAEGGENRYTIAGYQADEEGEVFPVERVDFDCTPVAADDIDYPLCLASFVNEPPQGKEINALMMPNPMLGKEELDECISGNKGFVAGFLVLVKDVQPGEEIYTRYGSLYGRDYETSSRNNEDVAEMLDIAYDGVDELIERLNNE